MTTSQNIPTTLDYINNPVPFNIVDIDPYLEKIKELVNHTDDLECSIKDSLANYEDRDAIWSVLPPEVKLELGYSVKFLGRKKQRLFDPEEHPTVVYCSGRMFGKTWLISQTVNYYATHYDGIRISIVGKTPRDVRQTLFYGESGILKLSHPDRTPIYNPSTTSAVWANGSRAQTYSMAEPDSLAGSECQLIIYDELLLADYQQEAYDQGMFTLRLGQWQQCVICSTPRPSDLARELLVDNNDVTVITGSSKENTALSDKVVKRLEKKYGGTRIGQTELHGKLLLDHPDAFWNTEMIEKCRVTKAYFRKLKDNIDRVVIAVDPSVSNNKSSDTCGIIVCALIGDMAYVVEDLSIKALPARWAKKAVDAYNRHNAQKCVIEVNQGGAMCRDVLENEDKTLNIEEIHHSKSKAYRMEPVSAMYEKGLVKHVGQFEKLENEMTSFNPKLGKNQKSPDRVDAVVMALTELLLEKKKKAWVMSD